MFSRSYSVCTVIIPFAPIIIPFARNLIFKYKTYVCPKDTTVDYGDDRVMYQYLQLIHNSNNRVDAITGFY